MDVARRRRREWLCSGSASLVGLLVLRFGPGRGTARLWIFWRLAGRAWLFGRASGLRSDLGLGREQLEGFVWARSALRTRRRGEELPSSLELWGELASDQDYSS